LVANAVGNTAGNISSGVMSLLAGLLGFSLISRSQLASIKTVADKNNTIFFIFFSSF